MAFTSDIVVLNNIDAFFVQYKDTLVKTHEKQFLQENVRGTSKEQYFAGLLWATAYLATIIKQDVDLNGGSWESYVTKYNLANIKKQLKCQGINLDNILSIFGLGEVIIPNEGISSVGIKETFQVAPFDDEVIVHYSDVIILEELTREDYCADSDFIVIDGGTSGSLCVLRNWLSMIMIGTLSEGMYWFSFNLNPDDTYNSYYFRYEQSDDNANFEPLGQGYGLTNFEIGLKQYQRCIIRCSENSEQFVSRTLSRLSTPNEYYLENLVKFYTSYNFTIRSLTQGMTIAIREGDSIIFKTQISDLFFALNGLGLLTLTPLNEDPIDLYVHTTAAPPQDVVTGTFALFVNFNVKRIAYPVISGNRFICYGSPVETLLTAAINPDHNGYQWYLDEVLIVGATSNEYLAVELGEYTCIVSTPENIFLTSNMIEVEQNVQILEPEFQLQSVAAIPKLSGIYEEDGVYYLQNNNAGVYLNVINSAAFFAFDVANLIEFVNYTAPSHTIGYVFINSTDTSPAIFTQIGCQITRTHYFNFSNTKNIILDNRIDIAYSAAQNYESIFLFQGGLLVTIIVNDLVKYFDPVAAISGTTISIQNLELSVTAFNPLPEDTCLFDGNIKWYFNGTYVPAWDGLDVIDTLNVPGFYTAVLDNSNDPYGIEVYDRAVTVVYGNVELLTSYLN